MKRTLLSILAHAVCLGLLCWTSFSFAQGLLIRDIRVEGLQRVSASPVFAALPLAAGDYATPSSIQTTIRALFATGFFDDVDVLYEEGLLIIRVEERPTISSISIDGNKAIKTEALQDVMKDNGLAEGEIFKRSTLDGILSELEKQYVSQGRYGAKVEADIKPLPNKQLSIDIQVDEGDVAKIKHINIVGNEKFSTAELLKLFEQRSTGWLSWLRSDDKYAREKLKGDIETLESFYLDQGYLDFELVSSQVSLSPDQKSVYITLNIKEGEAYTVNKIELAGDLIVDESRLKRLVLLQEGKTFSQVLMTQTSEYMTTLMGNAGYTNAEVEGIPERNKEDNTVDVTFLVNPSQRVYVRRISFRGNTKTNDEVLRREMRQIEGSSASNARIEQGKVRLERLGFFRGVEVENKDVPGSSDLIDVEYSVEEQPSGSINASVGYGQGTGLLLGASLQQNNWMGTGKQVGVSVNFNEFQTAYNFSYTDPYFTPDGVSRGISLFFSKRDFSRINVTSFTTNSYGMNLNFGYPISEIQRLNFGVGYTNLSVRTGELTAQEIRRTPFDLDLENRSFFAVRESDLVDGLSRLIDTSGTLEDFSLVSEPVTEDMFVSTEPGFVDEYGDKFDTFSGTFSWVRSTLNRGILATRGSRQTLSMDVTVPGSDLQYFTIEYDGQLFKPLYKDFVMRFRTSLGYGDGYGEMKRLPFFQNFFSGGFGSVRGFRRSSLGPQASDPAIYRQILGDRLGTPAVFPIGLDNLAVDMDRDGIADSYLSQGNGFILCESDREDSLGRPTCVTDQLQLGYNTLSRRTRAFGGNMLIEAGVDLIFPLPFIEDQRSFQTSLFLDAGNVFDTECSDTQVSCSDFDIDQLRVSVGIGLNWISPMGPLTFSLAKPLEFEEGDRRESFQFSLASPF